MHSILEYDCVLHCCTRLSFIVHFQCALCIKFGLAVVGTISVLLSRPSATHHFYLATPANMATHLAKVCSSGACTCHLAPPYPAPLVPTSCVQPCTRPAQALVHGQPRLRLHAAAPAIMRGAGHIAASSHSCVSTRRHQSPPSMNLFSLFLCPSCVVRLHRQHVWPEERAARRPRQGEYE